jgi:hypothetical protein|tara:strand:- start:576 stop:965 length:390 start_codon:yes stop_codon:yes gene_type:complete
MPLESKLTEQQLFDQLISSLVHSTWISLGKIKNPITDKVEKDIQGASMNIDMVDMLYKRMDGNLSDNEDQYLSQILSELKSNYINEKSQTESSEEDKFSTSASENIETNKDSQEKSTENENPKCSEEQT